ncbi:MAG: ribosome biogenesis GTPase Der [Candidatus Omnitrophica bacterium]|nr:ribosome biogenesis GTPase Der [Candidatus Omnitrophota bacterium]
MGRPNVGKSTLFNRLLGRRKAVVSSTRGTTRDRLFGTLMWQGRALTLIDAGGMEPQPSHDLSRAVQRHVQQALREADGIVLLCDAQQGLIPADLMILERLRPLNKPIALAVNKLDDRAIVPPEFFSLGLPDPLPLSALHGRGAGELLDRIVHDQKGSAMNGQAADPTISVAIVGRQNVGKSSLLNALLREERAIVSPTPGTTRDAIDTELILDGAAIRLIDTAGLRHRRKVSDPVDHYAMSRTTEALAHCTVALVVLDATLGIARDDQRMLHHVADAGCGCVIAINKWDLLKARERSERDLASRVHHQASAVPYAPVIATSATTGFHVVDSLRLALRVAKACQRGADQTQAIAWLTKAWQSHPPPRWRGRVIRLHHAEWLPGRPNQLRLHLRPTGWLPRPYQQYLLKHLYDRPQVAGVPIRLVLRGPSQERR